jgi:hypothetical protein
MVHPDHGEPVVFLPGDLRPPWAAEAYRKGRYVDGDDQVVKLGLAAGEVDE